MITYFIYFLYSHKHAYAKAYTWSSHMRSKEVLNEYAIIRSSEWVCTIDKEQSFRAIEIDKPFLSQGQEIIKAFPWPVCKCWQSLQKVSTNCSFLILHVYILRLLPQRFFPRD